MLFNYDVAMATSGPVFVVEGMFDAVRLNGVAFLGNTISEEQAYTLNSIKRQKILIPDRGADGLRSVKEALEFGWDISLPDIGACKDIDEAAKIYGMCYIAYQLKHNVCSGDTALLRATSYCSEKYESI